MQEGPSQASTIPDRLERLSSYTDAQSTLSWQRLNPIQLPPPSDWITSASAGHFICITTHSVLVYRLPSRLRGITERTWHHEFDFPGYYILWAGVEPDEDLLLFATHPIDQELRRSEVDNADFTTILSDANAYSHHIMRFFSIETGAPHPSALSSQVVSPSLRISVHGDYYMVGKHIYNWKANAEKPIFVRVLLLFQRCCSLN
jgi:hypothetical protein